MTQNRLPTLEDLRHADAPAWLWDGERGRLVWANAAGVARFGGESVFDLVDRPFDRREDGVARIATLIHALEPGQSTKADLKFPSVGADVQITAHCSLHLLADGRQGVLVVGEAPQRALADLPGALASVALASLPIPLLVIDAEGSILHANGAAKALLDFTATRHLRQVFVQEENVDILLRRLDQADITSSIESITATLGLRDVRITMARLDTTNNFSVMLEDVTDRRALERSLAASAGQAPHSAKTPKEAFAQLAKSLQDSIGAHPQKAQAPVASPAEIEVTAAKSPPAAAPAKAMQMRDNATKPQATPAFVPHPVRASLENTGQAILIGKGDEVFFATAKAAALLGYDTVDALLTDTALWQHLKPERPAPYQITVPLAGGGSVALSISPGSIPWLNGPAEQLVLKPIAVQPATEPAPVPAPEIETAPAHGAQRHASAASDQIIEAEELKAMLDVASDGIIALDEKGAILSFSAGAQSIFGVTADEVKTRSMAELLTPESRKPLRDYLAALNGPGLASVFNVGREFTAIVKQGGEVPLFVTLGKLQSPHSKAAFCAVVRDLTSWKRTERELREAKEAAEQASKQKSDFLAGISHEIRTPLNAIIGFSDVMRLERFGEIKNDKYRAYANDIHTSGAHLLALVNDLLDLSKVEAGKLELDFTAVNVADVVDHSLRLLQEEAARAGIVVRKSLAQGLPRVVADLRALRQVLLNLISNAVKYTRRGGQVIVSAQLDQTGELLLRVKDTGDGMTETQLHEALQPYARVEATAHGQKGTGLGLPLSKALVEANRARFVITSVPGEGTLAEIRFPATRVLAE